jgi:hypothetical protein
MIITVPLTNMKKRKLQNENCHKIVDMDGKQPADCKLTHDKKNIKQT